MGRNSLNWKPPQCSSGLEEIPLGAAPRLTVVPVPQHNPRAAALPSTAEQNAPTGDENSLSACLRGGDWKKRSFYLLSGCKVFRLTLWSHSQICSVSSKNSHFERERQSFASWPSPSVCFHSPDGGDGAGEPTPHTSPRFTPACTPLSCSGLQRRCSHQTTLQGAAAPAQPRAELFGINLPPERD